MNSLAGSVQHPAPMAKTLTCREFHHLLPDVLLGLNIGIGVLDEDGRVVAVDRALRRIIESADQLVAKRCRIFAASAAEDATLQAAVKASYRTTGGRPAPRAIPIWGNADHALVVSIHPLDVDDGAGRHARATMLMAIDTAPSVSLDDGFLREAFHLTDAEALVAKRLVGGKTLADIADNKGISINTARAQLKSVMQKTGVSRQSELVNLLSRCDNALRLTRPGRGWSSSPAPRPDDAHGG